MPDVDLSRTLREHVAAVLPALEREYLAAMLTLHEGRIGKASEAAGISRRTMLRKMQRYGLGRHVKTHCSACGAESSQTV